MSQNPFLDWISCTFYFEQNLFQNLSKTFGLATELKQGLRGYSHSYRFGNGGVLAWSPARLENKVYLMLSSKALAESQKEGLTAFDILRDIIRLKGQFTRIDIAIDDEGERLLRLDRILEKCYKSEIVTRFARWTQVLSGEVDPDVGFALSEIISGSFRDTEEPGRTIYIGSRASESFVRFYDKRAQVLVKAKDTRPEDLPEHWIRFELESKGERADAIARAIDDGSLNITGYLRQIIDFKRPNKNEERKTRWTTSKWWSDFLGNAEKQKLTLPKYTPGLEEIVTWLKDQISGALYLAEETGRLSEVLNVGQIKIQKNMHYQRILATEKRFDMEKI